MEEEKQVSKWQFIDKYYDFLIEMYKTIREAYMREEYGVAFKDMEQIVFHIYSEIGNVKNGKERAEKIKERIKIIYEINNQLNLLGINQEYQPEDYKFQQMSDLQNQLRTEVSLLYFDITSIISELNMFMPKQRVDNSLPMYKP